MRALGTALTAAALALSAGAAPLPQREMEMIREIAIRNGLDFDGACLLMAIRKIENGRPGLEFGIGGPVKNHPSRRFADGVKSFHLQGDWAAGTVKKRYNGDIDAFARRYCPGKPEHWAKLAKSLMAEYRADPETARMFSGLARAPQKTKPPQPALKPVRAPRRPARFVRPAVGEADLSQIDD